MLASAFNCSKFSDYTITNTGNGDRLHLHRVILNTIPYFKSLFDTQTKEVVTGNLLLGPEDFICGQRILEFLYTRRVPSGALLKPKDWLDTLAMAEMWQYHEMMTTCIPVVIHLIIDDWNKNFSSLHDLMNPKYANIITWFFNNQTFLDGIVNLLSKHTLRQEVWDIVTHPKYPFREAIRSSNEQVLITWMKSHSLTQEEALYLQNRTVKNPPISYGSPNDYNQRPMTPDYDEEEYYYGRYPDSP